MKLPLFKAAFKDQQTSMWIYVGVMLFYGLLIMVAYLSVEDTLSDPLSRADGIVLTKIGEGHGGSEVFNLRWETKAGTASHIALGFDTDEENDLMNFTFEDIEGLNITLIRDLYQGGMNSSLFEEYLETYPWLSEFLNETLDLRGGAGEEYPPPIPLDGIFPDVDLSGIELVYFGEEAFVNFTNSGTSEFFIVGLIPNDWNLSNMEVLGPVTSFDLVKESDFDAYLEDNPMMEALLGDEFVSFTTLDGFVALEYFSMWPLMLLIFMAIKTGGTVSKHIDDQSIDILLATGYSRMRFLNEKMLVIAVNLVLVVVAAWIGIILGIFIIGEPVPVAGITYAFIGSLPLALGIIGLSLLLSVLIDENSKTTGAILGLTIFMFMIQIVSNIAGWSDSLGYVSLFTYYNMIELMVRHSFDMVNVIVPTLIGVVSIIASYILFKKKEIHA
ncbi:MAG: ABC transporter permease subunit [Thermoplasmatota archaeon]